MHSRKDVFRCFFGLLLGLACVGCHTLTQRPVSVAPLGPRRVYDPTPRPPLQKIADPPSPMPAAPSANPVEASPLPEPTPSVPAQPAPLQAPPPPAATTSTTPPEAPPEPMPAPQPQPTLPAPPQTDTTSPSVAGPVNPLHRLYQQAVATYATIPGYRARLRQRERVNGKDHPEELMQFQFRKQPWSVYYQWIGPEGHGREVVYVKGAFDGKIHSRLAAGDVFPLSPAGMRFSVAPDSPMARGRSRHPIGEAGIGVLIDRFGQLVAAGAMGDPRFSGLKYLGSQQPPEFPTPLEMVEQVIPPGLETPLPHGGSRKWGFALDSHLPVFISTRDEKGQEVEYYCYEQLEYPVQLTDDDFNPDRLWARRSH